MWDSVAFTEASSSDFPTGSLQFLRSIFLNSSFDLGLSSSPSFFCSLLLPPRALTTFLGTAKVFFPVSCTWPPRRWETDDGALRVADSMESPRDSLDNIAAPRSLPGGSPLPIKREKKINKKAIMQEAASYENERDTWVLYNIMGQQKHTFRDISLQI